MDGQWILFASSVDEGIWRCRKSSCLQSTGSAPRDAGELVVPGVKEQDAYNWVPAREGIYFVRRYFDVEAPPEVAFFRFADNSTQKISALPVNFRGWGMTLAPDESRLYFTEMTEHGADLKIARP